MVKRPKREADTGRVEPRVRVIRLIRPALDSECAMHNGHMSHL